MNRGKLEVVMAELDRIGLKLLGVSEMKWSCCEQVQIDNFMVLNAGHDNLRRNGAAFITTGMDQGVCWGLTLCLRGSSLFACRQNP